MAVQVPRRCYRAAAMSLESLSSAPSPDPQPGDLANHVPSSADVGEPLPFRFSRLSGRSPALLVCDHASNRVPCRLDDLGLPPEELERHIGWDIGAAGVAERLAIRLDAPLVESRFSRLVIDANRHLSSGGLIPPVSDGTPVPGNDLDGAERARRIDGLYLPYHQAVMRLIEARIAQGLGPALVFMHSFTPRMNGFERPWEIGILWDRDPRLPRPLIERLRAMGLRVGDNEPYSGRSPEDYGLHAHGEARGLPCVLIELRQDLVADQPGMARWAAILEEALGPLLRDPATFAAPAPA